MSIAQKSANNSSITGPRIAIRPKIVLFMVLGMAAIGLTFWGMSSDSPPTEELVSDDEFVDGMKSPLGALGVSDSAAGSANGNMPLVLPNVTPDGLATSSSAGRNTGLTGPLFNESISTSASARPRVAAAGFEQTMVGSPTDAARPLTGATRVTANQPVWLTGNIEPVPTQGRATSR